MKIKDLKRFLNELPDEMPVGILDMTTDDVDDANYPISRESLQIMEYVNFDEENEIKGEMLFFTFINSLNENPI